TAELQPFRLLRSACCHRGGWYRHPHGEGEVEVCVQPSGVDEERGVAVGADLVVMGGDVCRAAFAARPSEGVARFLFPPGRIHPLHPRSPRTWDGPVRLQEPTMVAPERKGRARGAVASLLRARPPRARRKVRGSRGRSTVRSDHWNAAGMDMRSTPHITGSM